MMLIFLQNCWRQSETNSRTFDKFWQSSIVIDSCLASATGPDPATVPAPWIVHGNTNCNSSCYDKSHSRAALNTNDIYGIRLFLFVVIFLIRIPVVVVPFIGVVNYPSQIYSSTCVCLSLDILLIYTVDLDCLTVLPFCKFRIKRKCMLLKKKNEM